MLNRDRKYRAGMFLYALAFLLGVLYVQQLSHLPDSFQLFTLLLCLSALHFVLSRCLKLSIKYQYFTLTLWFIILILLGIIYSTFYAKNQLAYRLDDRLIGKDIVITGIVSSIPMVGSRNQRFEFHVVRHRILGFDESREDAQNFPKKIRVSWYYGQPVNAGESWQFEVRLKPPHGFMNPGGFDYEAWLFQQGIQATGYVRKSDLNIRNEISQDMPQVKPVAAFLSSINKIRQVLSSKIESSSDNRSISLIKALAVGDKSSISDHQWLVLTNTGTSHLMAISGLHIGLAAFFAYVLIRRLVPVTIMKRMPAQHVALFAGMFSALLYAMVAGLSVPTQRAMIMLMVLSVMMLLRRNHRPIDALGFALVLVLLFDPTAVLSVGFWFSFSAVAVIFLSITQVKKNPQLDKIQQSWWYGLIAVIKQWVRLQLLISIFLLPLSLFMFQQVSLVSPLANLILIPYVSFIVVPLVLLGIVCSFLLPTVSILFFSLSALLLDAIWPFLNMLSELPYSVWVRGDINSIKLLLLTLALLLIYFSKRISIYIVSYLLIHFSRHQSQSSRKYVQWALLSVAVVTFFSVLFINKTAINKSEFTLTMLDVGQGSSAVIQTKNYVLVFDAGAKFSDRMDVGKNVVIPYLRSQGIRSLDTLLISHGDADHIGGAPAIIEEYPKVEVIGQDIEALKSDNKHQCVQGQAWHWDGVDFEILSPSFAGSQQFNGKRNDRSCVLQVTSDAGSLLLTGDIEKNAENFLLVNSAESLRNDVLVVPHHGSKTSSGKSFVSAVSPKFSLISVGYKNRYHLPNDKVVTRYKAIDAQIMRTDRDGAVTVKFTSNTPLFADRFRSTAGKYWNHNVQKSYK